MTEYRKPFKFGFKDGSGGWMWITDQDDKVLIHGQGDCCMIGGLQSEEDAKIVLEALNR